jgi:hypothetical protein
MVGNSRRVVTGIARGSAYKVMCDEVVISGLGSGFEDLGLMHE